MLPRTIGALLRSGVETISIMDDNSGDGTALAIDVLCATLSNVYRIPTITDLSGGLTMDGPVFGPILARDQPDWILVGDPDEFWISKSGDLRKTHALKDHDLVIIERFNAALRPEEPDLVHLETDGALRDLPLIVKQVQLSRELMDAEPEHRWITHKLAPKLMVRPDQLSRFGLGMHTVFGKEGTQLRRTQGQDVVIAHLPFSSYERFERKVNNARLVFERFDAEHSGNKAWHWRRWIEIQKNGKLREEYDRQFLSENELTGCRESGAVTTATGIFALRKTEADARRLTRERMEK
ncbi:hypothetical protein [Ponticoccus litoralis]